MNPILGVILALSGLGSLFGRKSSSAEQPLTDPEMRQEILDVLGIQKRRLKAQDPLLTAVNQMALGMLPIYARQPARPASGWTPPTDDQLLELAERIRGRRTNDRRTGEFREPGGMVAPGFGETAELAASGGGLSIDPSLFPRRRRPSGGW